MGVVFSGDSLAPDSVSTPGVQSWPLGFYHAWHLVAPGVAATSATRQGDGSRLGQGQPGYTIYAPTTPNWG